MAIDSWPRHSRYPNGHFVRALGPIGDKDTENEVLLLEHDVPHSRFSDAVLSFLPKLPWIITENVSPRVQKHCQNFVWKSEKQNSIFAITLKKINFN